MVERSALYPQHVARLLKIRSDIYQKVAELECEAALSKEPIKKCRLNEAEFAKFQTGMVWGSDFDCAWFKFKGQVPQSAKGKHVVALINIEGEGVVYNDGKAQQGITQVLSGIDLVQSRKGKQVVDLFEVAEGGENVDLLVDAGFNGKRHKQGTKVKLARKDIAICNDEILAYYYDYLQLFMLMLTFGKNEHLKEERVKEISKALSLSFKSYKKKDYVGAQDVLKPLIFKPIDYEATEYTAIGHAHIDLAWLWPIRETKRKGARTYATALHNIEKDPNYVFGASQAQLMQWIKEDEPELYGRFKAAVESGNVELQGGMWTENDCNIPSGESIIRQFLYGEKFFQDEFGKTSKMVWLPDVFGYPASLPQIIKKCGKDYFMTIKLTWNTHNKFPYKTFLWKGIDGTEVLSHMAPQGNYNSTASPMAMTLSNRGNPQKDKIGKALLIYGVGDGGGGPGEAHLNFVKRETYGLNKIVRRGAEELFKDLEKEYIEVIPKYEGELYLEKHQGTYTSQAKNKYYNRKLENDLHTLEWLCTVAQINRIQYDQERIDRIWKEVLLYQFHDIIPGSSIKRVYDESVARYEVMEKEIADMQSFILAKVATKQTLSVINPTDFERCEYIKIEDAWYKAEVNKYSAAALTPAGDFEGLKYSDDFISTPKIKVGFNMDGTICSLYDKEEQKELCGEYMNKLAVFTDPKMYYNAWDIRDDYRKLKTDEFKLVNFNSYIDGPEVVRENSYQYNKSSLVQRIKISIDSKLVSFETIVDWHESYKMLRAEFKPTFFADKVNCDIQFGNVDRSTHDDNPIEKAQFEICAHKFVNIDKEGYGLGLINNCKYGHRVKEGLISLNLLRSPKSPDPTCDMGKHHFSYALYPHAGSWEESDLVKQAYCFNMPLMISDYLVDIGDIVDVDNSNVIIETIKPSAKGDGFVVRLYERYGMPTSCKLRIGVKAKEVYLTNLIEDEPIKLETSKLDFGPYEIKTVLVKY